MDAQTAINVAFGLAGVLGGWVLKFLHGELKTLQVADTALTVKVQAIEVLVAGEYAKRDYLDERIDKMEMALFKKLDRIEALLASKADK